MNLFKRKKGQQKDSAHDATASSPSADVTHNPAASETPRMNDEPLNEDAASGADEMLDSAAREDAGTAEFDQFDTPAPDDEPTVENLSPDDVQTAPISPEAVINNEAPLVLEMPERPVEYTFTGVSDGVTRPLSADALPEIIKGNDHAIFAQATDVGKVRTNNEDAVFSFLASVRSSDELSDFGIFIVADGMGGHYDGEKASAMSTRSVASYILKNMYMPMLAGSFNNDVPIVEALEEAVQRANADIVAKVPDGGTTITIVVMIGDIAYIAHVGDSRAYLLMRNHIEQLTRDHSLIQRLIELDHITPEEANDYPNKNVLYRALGQSENLEVDTLRRKLPPMSQLLLCSDGLWSQVQEHEMVEIINHAPNLQAACNQLITLANSRGGIDNVSLTILQLPK
ncbi:serine/threonine-protein phosphatase [Anaerolineae bacterium CFX9]|nr:protein phosphatase 2C domain-containing protein [Kamptonema cortianum]MDL1901693.1 serine/threonine-protein phosphatase [Anaerolineae bacterium CFX9]